MVVGSVHPTGEGQALQIFLYLHPIPTCCARGSQASSGSHHTLHSGPRAGPSGYTGLTCTVAVGTAGCAYRSRQTLGLPPSSPGTPSSGETLVGRTLKQPVQRSTGGRTGPLSAGSTNSPSVGGGLLESGPWAPVQPSDVADPTAPLWQLMRDPEPEPPY